MADIIQKNGGAHSPGGGSGLGAGAVMIIASVILGIVFFTNGSFIALAAGALSLIIGIAVLYASAGRLKENAEIKSYGNKGERRAGFILEKYLPDGYTVIQNAVIRYNGETSETDNIVVGRTGVFIIEVKNMKGTVYGDYDEKSWEKVKTDRYNIEHESIFHSPVKQVGTHRYRLAKLLRANGIRCDVECAVYFVNPETVLKISGDGDVPVLTSGETRELINYITRREAVLDGSTVNRIIDLLTK
ncbi:MAG: NERD domain-containing protein [Eubacterium sp.]|nr:NERD domain-containing protein [Eubacterium sp.]